LVEWVKGSAETRCRKKKTTFCGKRGQPATAPAARVGKKRAKQGKANRMITAGFTGDGMPGKALKRIRSKTPLKKTRGKKKKNLTRLIVKPKRT